MGAPSQSLPCRDVLCAMALVASAACSPAPEPESGGPTPIPWASLRNPVLGLEDAAIKDAYAVRNGDRWHFGYSHIIDDPLRFKVGFSATDDWQSFDHGQTFDDPALGGLASPTVTRMPDGRWLLTYNSHTHDVNGTANKLYYRTSDDFVSWSEPTRLHIDGADAPEDRLIDVAIAFTDAGAFLFFKREQTASVAYSAMGALEGPWTLLGDMEPPNVENVQPIQIDGGWHVLATTIPILHRPRLYAIDGAPKDPQSWTKWRLVRELQVPEQSWNTGSVGSYERSNAAYLVDERAVDGHYYLLYAGSTELQTHGGRGYSRLGLARSRNLAQWEVPP